MLKLKYDLLNFHLYFYFKKILEATSIYNRIPICIFTFEDKSRFYIKREKPLSKLIHGLVSNHFVQCYSLVCCESKRILYEYQVFKEPDPYSSPYHNV